MLISPFWDISIKWSNDNEDIFRFDHYVLLYMFWNNYMWSSLSFVCRQSDFYVMTSYSLRVLLICKHSYHWHWIKVDADLGYCNSTNFQTRTLVQNVVLLGFFGWGRGVLFGFFWFLESVIFIRFWWCFIFRNSLRKSFSEKCMALLCNYYRFWHWMDQKEKNFKFLTFFFFSIFLHVDILPFYFEKASNRHLIET